MTKGRLMRCKYCDSRISPFRLDEHYCSDICRGAATSTVPQSDSSKSSEALGLIKQAALLLHGIAEMDDYHSELNDMADALSYDVDQMDKEE